MFAGLLKLVVEIHKYQLTVNIIKQNTRTNLIGSSKKTDR